MSNEKQYVVEIAEMIKGYYQVQINELPIANYRTFDEANKLVKHFISINPDKNIKVLD
jgi:hypothetical protein